MPSAKIGNKLVNGLRPGPRHLYIWDTELPGFGVRCSKGGVVCYVVQYRVSGGGRGRTRRLTLGRHGVLTPDQARRKARRILAEAVLGDDPAGEEAEARRRPTVGEVCEWYLAEGCTTKKPSTLATDRGRIERHIKPLLGRQGIEEVTRGDVERWLREVAAGRTARNEKTGFRGRSIVKGGKGTATRTLGLLGSIFSFAVARGLRDDNPVRGVKRWPDRKMNRFLSPAELARLGEALREAQEEGENLHAVAALRLLALTGCRRGEVLGLRWEEVDFEHACLRLSDSKTGERVVPLGPSALEVLAKLPRLEGNPYVLPGTGAAGHLVNLKKPWERIRARAGLEGVRIHDLRHTMASVAAGSGVGLVLIGGLLGHKVPATTARYAHLADDPLRMAAQQVQGSIAAAMAGGQRAKVMKLADRRRRPPG